MSAEAWAAFFEALWDAVYPIAIGFWGGWYFHGHDLRGRRKEDR